MPGKSLFNPDPDRHGMHGVRFHRSQAGRRDMRPARNRPYATCKAQTSTRRHIRNLSLSWLGMSSFKPQLKWDYQWERLFEHTTSSMGLQSLILTGSRAVCIVSRVRRCSHDKIHIKPYVLRYCPGEDTSHHMYRLKILIRMPSQARYDTGEAIDDRPPMPKAVIRATRDYGNPMGQG